MQKDLLLIPTEYELSLFPQTFVSDWRSRGHEVELCGFGIVASGIMTTDSLHRWRYRNGQNPRTVILVGLAGAYREEITIGSAMRFDRTALHGIGCGDGENFQSSDAMGWKMFQQHSNAVTKLNCDAILGLSVPSRLQSEMIEADEQLNSKLLLTVAAASSNRDEVVRRRNHYPDAVAEDMEGFSVASACALFGVNVTIIRGISNVAGDRNQQNWKCDLAIQSVVRELSLPE